jgi:hypothetical protein
MVVTEKVGAEVKTEKERFESMVMEEIAIVVLTEERAGNKREESVPNVLTVSVPVTVARTGKVRLVINGIEVTESDGVVNREGNEQVTIEAKEVRVTLVVAEFRRGTLRVCNDCMVVTENVGHVVNAGNDRLVIMGIEESARLLIDRSAEKVSVCMIAKFVRVRVPPMVVMEFIPNVTRTGRLVRLKAPDSDVSEFNCKDANALNAVQERALEVIVVSTGNDMFTTTGKLLRESVPTVER